MANSNYLIGNGERLVSNMKWKPRGDESSPVYKFDEVLEHTREQWDWVQEHAQTLPELACPQDRVVFSITLHPKYLAMSHYPRSLFKELDVQAVGSRTREMIPRKPRTSKQTDEDKDIAPEYFLAAQREQLVHITQRLKSLRGGQRKDFAKIEEVRPLWDKRIILPDRKRRKPIFWEAVLQGDDDYVLEGFERYLYSIDTEAHWDKLFQVDGLWFVALKETVPRVRDQVGLFSFLRVVRPMPSLGPIDTVFREVKGKVFQIPQQQPLDDQVRVAILDGGLPEDHGLDTWVNLREPSGLGPPVPLGLKHGLAVTSAFLFGPLHDNDPPEQAPCKLDHWRVLDQGDGKQSDPELFSVLQRVVDIIDSNQYQLVNLSLGPSLPVEDGEPHLWTAVLDKRLKDGNTLLCTAAGNWGEKDRDSGNARIQPPSDTVNGLGVGAADLQNQAWGKAPYSCIGPGRRPGFIKPDILAFGGTAADPFKVLGINGGLTDIWGTSFAAPYAARHAMGIATFFQRGFNAVALKALLIHNAEANGHDPKEVGWGKLPDNLNDLVTSADNQAHILYQGTLTDEINWRLPIPMPDGTLPGMVTIRATICFATPVDANHPLSYTQADLDVVFRPSPEIYPDKTMPFFQNKDYWHSEIELRKEAHKWEPVLRREKRFRGSTLSDPQLELHYLNRDCGQRASQKFDLPYAAVITVTAPRVPDLYNQIVNRYRLQLAPLRPRLRVQERLRV